ncbi:MAG TPA: PilN domain-containing protein [Vicinamibacterales bacterium]|nr:PilN domain-containing protein [Vicinamibacterales bacterium]
MIRINLLATERRAAKSAAIPGMQAGQKMMVIGSLLLVLTVAMIGWRYWALSQEEAQVGREIEAAQREEARLQEILKQVQEFENRRKLLEARVALIDELRKGQSAPVHMVDQISKALPDMTWLTAMQQSGYTLTMQGRCLTLTSLSDFIGNLEASRYFIRPVEIIETTTDTSDKGPELIHFTIRGTFQMAGVESVAPPPPGAKGAARGGKRG